MLINTMTQIYHAHLYQTLHFTCLGFNTSLKVLSYHGCFLSAMGAGMMYNRKKCYDNFYLVGLTKSLCVSSINFANPSCSGPNVQCDPTTMAHGLAEAPRNYSDSA